MSGALQINVKPPQASPMADQPAPWDSADVNLEAKRLDALGEIARLQRDGRRAQSREELSKLKEKFKGTPAEAGYKYMLGLEDYSQALDDHIKQLAADRRNGPAPITDAPPADVAPVREQVAWAGEGGPEVTGDAAQEYASATQAANDDAATSAMFDAYDSENPPETGVGPDGSPQLKAPELPVGAAAKPRGGAEPGTQGTTRSLRDLITGKPKLPTFTDDPVHNAGLVAADIGTGIVESPKAILGGVRNGINELAGSIDSAGAWVATQAMLAEGDTAGAAKLAARRAAGETVLENQLPAVGDPRTGTGKLVEGVTQFVTGFVAGGKVLKAGGFLGTLGKSAFSDAFAFDPARYRLANLIEENPALKNPVTEFLASKPGDTEAEGRLKNVLESGALGLGVQGLTNVFIAGLKGLRSVNHLTPPKPPSAAEAEAIATKQVQEGTAPLGDPNAPLITTRDAPGAQPVAGSAKPAASDGGTLTLYQGSPHKYDGELSNAHIGTGEGTAIEGHGHYLAEARDVGQVYQAMLSKVERADGAKVSAGLKEELKSRAGDLDGVEAMLHEGLRAEMARPKPSAARVQSIKSDIAEIADIRRVGLKDTGAVYKLNVAAKPSEIIDLEASVSPALAKQFGIEAGLTGKAFYQKLSKKLGGDHKASEALNAAGTKGLRYKDSFSRGKDGGTYNYVIFDAKHIKKVPLGADDVAAIEGRKPSQTPLEQPPMGSVPLGEPGATKNVFINFARIDTPEDVKALMQQTANLHADEIAQAQRNSPVWFRGQGSGTVAEIKPAISENTGGVPVVFASSQKDVAHGYADATGMPTATVHALTSEAKNPLVIAEWAGKKFDQIPMASIIKKAKDAGHDAVIFKRIDDNADALGKESGRSLSDVIAWLDPKGFKAASAAAVKAGQSGISHNATKQLADDMGMSVNDLLSRRRGPNGARQPFTAEEALAARRIYTASGQKLMELAERAAGPNAGEIDLFNLRQMMSKHLAIQNEVLGARTETARALASWRIEAGAGQAQMNAIKAMMETAGPETQKMARELMNLRATGAPPSAIGAYVRKSAIGSIGQGIREVYVNGLLSGPLTHIVNTFGNTLTLGLSVAERAVARTISKHVTASDAVAEGEANAMLHGIIEGQRDALRLAWKATGDVPSPDHLGKIDTPRVAAISSTRNDAFGTAVNVIGATTRAPSLLMAAADKYFRAVNYRANLHA